MAALNLINYITLYMPGCFVLGVDTFLSQRHARLEVNWDMMFIEDPSQVEYLKIEYMYSS